MPNVHWWMASLLCSAVCAQPALADLNGGGSTLPQPLYQTPGVLTAGFAPYLGLDQRDREAFLNNDYGALVPGDNSKNVHWIATESKLTSAQLSNYATVRKPAWGPLIQVPSAATSIAIAFNKPGGALNLSTHDLCGIFSGRLVDWSQLYGSARNGPITVVYPQGSSATTEAFTRFLNARCNESSGQFSPSRYFAYAHPYGPPANAVTAVGNEQIMATVNATVGSITFIGATYAASSLAGLEDGSKVARVDGVAPTPANIVDTINAIRTPLSPELMPYLSDPNTWVPQFAANPSPYDPSVVAYPHVGYPILGFTNLVFSQCYADATQTAQVRAFFSRHYNPLGLNDAAIRNNRLQPLPANWKAAIRSTFLTPASALSIGNPNVCNGIGRPL
ncbi:substrate-binding domain-containing protein [Pseudomonas protegens]|uniref:substrate-binding domain-containing protein n=1 Tax=Pseudomonas protegens TaxID=380021 RepID=UPI00383B72E7